MTLSFLSAIALLCIVAMTPILLPLLRTQSEDENSRSVHKQRNALAAARAAGVLSQAEYDVKLAALPAPALSTSRPARTLALALVVVVPLLALLLYRNVGELRALDPTAMVVAVAAPTAAPDLASAVTGLEQRLAATPDDIEGLRLLARGYQSMQRFTEARDTLAKVRALAADDLDIQVEYAEALALATPDRMFDGDAQRLIEATLVVQPDHQRGLWLAGISAMQRDDKPQAIAHWQRLLRQLPPESEVYASVSAQIRDLGGDVPAPTVATTPTDPSDSAANTDTDAITLNVRIAAALAARVAPGDIVYVFARAAEGPKMPLAISRFAASELPKSVTLDDSMGMMPTLKLSQQAKIVIGARISKTGNATPQSGDFEVLTAALDRAAINAPIDLEIATVVP